MTFFIPYLEEDSKHMTYYPVNLEMTKKIKKIKVMNLCFGLMVCSSCCMSYRQGNTVHVQHL